MITERIYSFKGIDYRIACTDTYPQHPSWFSFEDESSVRDALWNIAPGDCVFDVGAAYGSYTMTALSQGAARVFAWSPQGESGIPQEADFMDLSLALNNWTDKCTIYRSGVYRESGWLNASTQEFSPTEPPVASSDVIRVDVLDDWFVNEFAPQESKHSYSRFWLKLDVEGAEVDVLSTSSKLISALRPHIQVENHNFKRPVIEQEVRDLVLSYGYREVSRTPYHAVSHSLFVPA